MNKGVMMTLGAVGGVLLMLVLVVVGSYVSNYNYGNKAENELAAIYTNNQNILSNYTQKVMEAAQIPTMMKDDVKELLTAVMAGRYGDKGSQATFQWIKEQNISVEPTLYTKLQQIIEAGRDEFRVAQTRLIDAKTTYKTNLGYLWKGFWLGAAGYPKVNLDDFKVVLDQQTNDTFKSGVSAPLKLR